MGDSIQVAKLKREIARLRRLHKERSIDEAELVEGIEKLRRSDVSQNDACVLGFMDAFLELAREEKKSIEEQLAPKIADLDAMTQAVQRTTRHVLDSDRRRYTAPQVKDRLYVEDIDSFKKVRDVNPAMVSHLLRDGFLAISEDQVQIALEEILNVSFHRKDWGGEINDLYTANVVVNGERRATAFLLKGPGIGKKVMEIADCGKRGDQIVRLFDTPADLFVVQYVGPISDFLIKDVQAKVANLRASGKEASFLIMDGQDTARVLHAYGKL